MVLHFWFLLKCGPMNAFAGMEDFVTTNDFCSSTNVKHQIVLTVPFAFVAGYIFTALLMPPFPEVMMLSLSRTVPRLPQIIVRLSYTVELWRDYFVSWLSYSTTNLLLNIYSFLSSMLYSFLQMKPVSRWSVVCAARYWQRRRSSHTWRRALCLENLAKSKVSSIQMVARMIKSRAIQ
jgi:hypothetical protein